MSHVDDRTPSDLFRRAVIAALLYDLIENNTKFFGAADGSQVKENFKEVLLLQLQICPINNVQIDELIADPDNEFDISSCGTAIYSFGSMFNHSCCHNVHRNFHGSSIVLRAANTIKKEKQCFITYGYVFDCLIF